MASTTGASAFALFRKWLAASREPVGRDQCSLASRAEKNCDQQDQALRRNQPAVVHPVARTHPFTGRKCLYVSKGECEGIEGMAQEEALKLVDQLADITVEERFRYTHRWQVRDLLMWDNCALQHLASFDYQWPQHRRLMHRVTVGGSVPV